MYFDHVTVPAMAARFGADVLLSTTGFASWRSPVPQVLLIRNMAYFDPLFHARYRELGRSLRRNTVRRWLSVVSARRSDVVLFPTEATRREVQRYVSLADKTSRAIHYGFDSDALAREDHEFPQRERIRQWREEGYQLLLSISTYAVQKNFETVAEALGVLKKQGRKVKLLTTLSREKTTDLEEYDALMRRIEELDVSEDFVQLGYVPYNALSSVYAEADAYVFPSFTESFGHSLVEAMSQALPVVAAGTAVNREVCEDAAVYFDAFDVDDCAGALLKVLDDEAKQRTMAEASRHRAKHFSWQKYAEELVDVFEAAIGGRAAVGGPAEHRASRSVN